MIRIFVNLGKDSYPIYIKEGLLQDVSASIQEVFHGKRIMIISDDNVYPLYGELIKSQLQNFSSCSHLVLPHGELTKDFQTLPAVYSAFIEAGITRSDLIIALGGGVIGDLAGFAASSFLRGVDFVQIPTSLLAQVDSSVGGKVAVDLPEGKNLVGAFYQPKMVLIDPLVLKSLPERFVRDGMGEVIKYGCIFDKKLFDQLEAHPSFADLSGELTEVIARCVDLKRMVVEQDQFDKGERMLLNFGHTLAHAIEQYYHYERESHGEAVAIGMYQISRLAEEADLSAPDTSAHILKVLKQYGLPYESGILLEELLSGISKDKKNLNQKLNLVFLKKIGESFYEPMDVAFFDKKDYYV